MPDGGAYAEVLGLLKRSYADLMQMATVAITVKPNLDKPYPDDPQWSPWTRFVERPARDAHETALALRKLIHEAEPDWKAPLPLSRPSWSSLRRDGNA